MNNKHTKSHVQSLAKALQIIDFMGAHKKPVSLKEISEQMGWPKSTIHGLLATLRDYNFVSQSAVDGKYILGIRLFELGNALMASWDISRAAHPLMVQLNSRFGETVHLATEEKGEVLYLEKIDSNHLLRIVSQVGARLPMHCTGVGKVLLAYRTPKEIRQIIQAHPLESYTSKTITNPLTLEKELERIRERGFAYDEGEIMDSLRCVAAPIFSSDGSVSYSLSVSGLDSNIGNERLETITKALLNACAIISKEMGYKG